MWRARFFPGSPLRNFVVPGLTHPRIWGHVCAEVKSSLSVTLLWKQKSGNCDTDAEFWDRFRGGVHLP